MNNHTEFHFDDIWLFFGSYMNIKMFTYDFKLFLKCSYMISNFRQSSTNLLFIYGRSWWTICEQPNVLLIYGSPYMIHHIWLTICDWPYMIHHIWLTIRDWPYVIDHIWLIICVTIGGYSYVNPVYVYWCRMSHTLVGKCTSQLYTTYICMCLWLQQSYLVHKVLHVYLS